MTMGNGWGRWMLAHSMAVHYFIYAKLSANLLVSPSEKHKPSVDNTVLYSRLDYCTGTAVLSTGTVLY